MIMPFSRTDTKVAICSLHGDQSIPDCTRWWLLFPTIPRSLASEKKGLLCSTSVACAVGPSVATPSTEFSFQNLFLEFIWIFSSRNHLEINISRILNPNLTKWIPLNPAHQDLSNKHQWHIPILQNFQQRFNFIFSEEIIQYSKTFALHVQTSWNQAHAPLLVESFPKTPRTQSEASPFGGSHNYKTKQTKLPS